jgi:two-component system chemotaxis sensor kinase CheA
LDLSDGITQQDIKLFLTEADEQLQLLDEDIVRLEKESSNINLLQEIFRASHTIKGSSAMLGHQRMSDLAHGMENVLDKLRKGTLTINSSVVDALLESLDVLRALKEELVTGQESQVDINSILGRLEGAMLKGDSNLIADTQSSIKPEMFVDNESNSKQENVFSKGEPLYQVKVSINKDTSWASVRCFQVVQELSKIASIINSKPSLEEIEAEKAGFTIELVISSSRDQKTIEDVLHIIPEIERIVISSSSGNKTTPPANEKPAGCDEIPAKKEDGSIKQTIRVDVSRVDTLMEQIGELVINRNHIGQIGKNLVEKYQDDELIRSLVDSLSQTGKIVNILQQDIMSIRMLPIELVFNTMPRMVRDLARKIGKKIDFIVEGQETEVDRSIIEHLRDPLIHLLRNSVDHGIETPEERKAAGKSETGVINLSAHHEQDHIVITVSDDGRGIDPKAVKAASISKGVISSEVASRLTEDELINLILESGVSTAKKVTEVSGRGVGLDIVKKNIEFLNGTLTIDSKPGKGAKFILKLPLTLAIVPALLVSLEQTIYAIPLATIVETIKIEKKDIKTVMRKKATLFRGKVLLILQLRAVFGWSVDTTGDQNMNYIVVVKAGNMQVGLIVDALIGQQEIVVKSLDQYIGGVNGISGASILGDGQVVLILDVNSLVKSTFIESHNNQEEKEQSYVSTLSNFR